MSFDVAVLFEEDFTTEGFGEREILNKVLVELTGVEIIFKIFTLLAC